MTGDLDYCNRQEEHEPPGKKRDEDASRYDKRVTKHALLFIGGQIQELVEFLVRKVGESKEM